MSLGEAPASTTPAQAIHFTAYHTIHDQPLRTHGHGLDIDGESDDTDNGDLGCWPWIWLHDWYQRASLRPNRRNSSQVAETPFAVAAFSAIFGTFMLVRAIAVDDWLVDHTYWDGTGHAFDKEPLLALSTVETSLLALAMACGILCALQLIARTRFRFYAASQSCKYFAGVQAMLCLVAQYLFYQRASLDNNPGHAYSRGFWSCTVTSALSTVATFGFTVDWLLGYPYSDLSLILKGMVLPSVMACSTISLGALSFMNMEDWEYSEALMFCSTALTTIGYGDVTPRTNLGRIAFLFYASIGISVMGYFFLSIRAVITGSNSNIIKVNLVRVDSLREYSHKQRQKWLNLQRQDAPLPTQYLPEREPISRPTRGRTYSNTSNLSSYTLFNMLHEKDRQILVQIITRSGVVRMSLLLLLSLLGGAAVFCWLEEEWSYLDSLYFAFATLLTIGFGDLVPQTALAQEFWFFYVILSIAVAAYFISLFGDVLIEKLQIHNDSDEERVDDSNDEQEPRFGRSPPGAAFVDDSEAPVHPTSPNSVLGSQPMSAHMRASRRLSTPLLTHSMNANSPFYGSTVENGLLLETTVQDHTKTDIPPAESPVRPSPLNSRRHGHRSSPSPSHIPIAVTNDPRPIPHQR